MVSNSAVELKGSMYTFLSLKLHSNDVNSVAEALADKVQQAPGFFANTPIVVDLTEIEDQPGTDAKALLEIIRQHKLIPVVVSLRDKDSAVASTIDIPLVEAGSKKAVREKTKVETESPRSVSEPAAVSASEPENAQMADDNDEPSVDPAAGEAANNTGDGTKHDSTGSPADLALAVTEVEYIAKSPKLVTKPVRSGQQVYARDTDLVVIGGVGPGAEIIADNNIHVYGPLRGRALCGVAGNTEARIFCRSLEAELVSVAGNYKVLEQIPEELRGKPAQIWYQNDKLMIEPL